MYKIADTLFPHRARWQQVSLLVLVLAYFIAFTILPSGFDIPWYYLPALAGDKPMYYPYWAYWLTFPLALLPFKLNYLALIAIILIATPLIVRHTKGNPYLLFLSFPFIWVLWYGQIESLVAMGFAFMWHGWQKRAPFILGLGLFFTSLKPHIMGPAAMLVLFYLDSWRLRLKSLWLVGPVLLLSFIRWGWGWPIEWLNTISSPVFRDAYSNGSLWVWFGPWALILWVPALIVPMHREARVMLALTTALLTMPYVPPYSQLTLYFFPMPVWTWFAGQLPWAQLIVGDSVFRFNFLVPAALTLRIYARRQT